MWMSEDAVPMWRHKGLEYWDQQVSSKRNRYGKYPALEATLFIWMNQACVSILKTSKTTETTFFHRSYSKQWTSDDADLLERYHQGSEFQDVVTLK